MKKVLIGLTLALTLGLGMVAGFSQKREASEVKADGVSGTITIDMQNNCWTSQHESKLAVYFYNETVTPKLEGWSSLVHCDAGTQLAQIPYSLNFTPLNMIAVRFDSNATVADWNSSTHYNQTVNLDYSPNGNIMITNYDSTSAARVGTGYLLGKASDTNWEWTKYHFLSNVHVNARDHVEYFDEITLTQYEEFKFYLHNDYNMGFNIIRFDGRID